MLNNKAQKNCQVRAKYRLKSIENEPHVSRQVVEQTTPTVSSVEKVAGVETAIFARALEVVHYG